MPEQANTEEALIKALLEGWAGAVRRHDLPAILAHHDREMVMFDLPASLQCRGVEAHADSGSHGKGEAKRNDARSRETAVLLSALALGLTALLVSEPLRAQDRTPCLQIKTACEQPGFEQSDVGNSNGLQVNCIRPLMVAVPQRAKSTRPLPQVDAATILA